MIHKKKSPAFPQGNSISNHIHNTSIYAQRQRILKYLQQKPLSTIQARDLLNVMAPAPRIFELRHVYGFNIRTDWIIATDSAGRRHRMAQYVLLPGKCRGI